MSQRAKIKLFLRKRISFETRLAQVEDLINQEQRDDVSLRLRMTNLTDLYREIASEHNELMVLDEKEEHSTQLENMHERFYALAVKMETMRIVAPPSTASTVRVDEAEPGNSAPEREKRKRVKLPAVRLPLFDGKFENWLSFRNAFRNLIDSETDLSEIDKMNYLKSSLVGEAARKINIFSVDDTSYTQAWELLTRSYEAKRILTKRHLSAILNMPGLERETTDGLLKLADDMQQHVSALNALGTNFGQAMIVHLLEAKLPRSAVIRWDSEMDRDAVATPDQMYKFIYKAAVCASTSERGKCAEAPRAIHEPPAKRRRVTPSNRALMLNTPRNKQTCVVCKNNQHALHQCDAFKKMSVRERFETVRRARLCYNCFRSHRRKACNFANFSICHGRHNTLLYFERRERVSANRLPPRREVRMLHDD